MLMGLSYKITPGVINDRQKLLMTAVNLFRSGGKSDYKFPQQSFGLHKVVHSTLRQSIDIVNFAINKTPLERFKKKI